MNGPNDSTLRTRLKKGETVIVEHPEGDVRVRVEKVDGSSTHLAVTAPPTVRLRLGYAHESDDRPLPMVKLPTDGPARPGELAWGAQLDRYGVLLACPRNGVENDEDYRARLSDVILRHDVGHATRVVPLGPHPRDRRSRDE